jgi:carboxyl-terminal processing protease
MTTAKYYIPSGRCIQSVQNANGEPVIIPDDQRTPFKTRNGRTVLDGGGVKPDILMEEPEAPEILKALNKEDLVFKYVTKYCLNHETIPPVEEFKFTDFDDFRKFIRESNFTFNSSAEKDLTDLEKSVNNLALSRDIQQQISELKKKIKSETDMHVEKYKDEILAQIELDITGRYYFESGKTKQRLKNDKELQKAIEILNDKNAYQASLQ